MLLIISVSSLFICKNELNFGSKDSNGGDGIAFVMHNNGTSASGTYGDNKGYAGGSIKNAIVFDFRLDGVGIGLDWIWIGFVLELDWI